MLFVNVAHWFVMDDFTVIYCRYDDEDKALAINGTTDVEKGGIPNFGYENEKPAMNGTKL